MSEYLPMIINLLSGAGGGFAAGKLLKNFSLGNGLNALVGILGGGLGGKVLGMLGIGGGEAIDEVAGAATSGLDLTSILSSVAGGGVGGGVLMTVIGFIKKAMGKS